MTKKSKITLNEYVNNEVCSVDQYLHLAPLLSIESSDCNTVQLLFDSEFDSYCVLNKHVLQYVENIHHAKKLYREQIQNNNS